MVMPWRSISSGFGESAPVKANVLASWLAQIPGNVTALEDAAGRLVEVNEALCRTLGYESGELVGQPWSLLLAGQVEGTAGATDRSVAHLRRKDGSSVPAAVTAWRLPIGGEGGQRRLSVFALRESQRQQARSCQEEDRSPGDHRLASAVHELNNALTIISFHSQLMARLDPPSSSFGEHLAIVQDQVANTKRIVAELRPTSEREPGFEATDVNALIRYTLEIQELQLADVQVITDLWPDLPQIQADPHQLERVFINLINNAGQALADVEPPRVLWVSTRLVPGENGRPATIRICFINNGPVIPSDLLTRIFEPFFTTKEPGQGTGLGLTICERIVREHRGRIWAESPAPGGAVFVVELPAYRASAEKGLPSLAPALASERPQAAPHGNAGAGSHVLVVGGGSDDVHSVQQLLRQAGFDVALMPTGAGQLRCHPSLVGDPGDVSSEFVTLVARKGAA